MDASFAPAPAGGFRDSYLAHCNLRRTKPRYEVIDYMQDLEKEGIKELDLSKCPGTDAKSEIYIDLIAVGKALAHNIYFTSVLLSDIHQKDAFIFASSFLKYNQTITKVIVRNTSAECSNELGDALFDNVSHQFQILDFSGNTLTASSIVPFSRSIRNSLHLIKVISLRDCKLSCRSLSALIHAFKANWGLSLGLEELDLSDNTFDDTTTANFSEWFSLMKSHSNLRRIGLSNTNIDGVSALKAIKYCPKLEYVDLSHNNMEKVNSNFLEENFPVSKGIKVINVASTSMPADAIITLLRTLMKSDYSDLSINIASNSLGSKNAALIADVLRIMKNIRVLDISNNNLGKGCEAVISSIQDCLTVLIMDDNLNVTTNNETASVAQALAGLLESNQNLIKLSISNGKLKGKIRGEMMEKFFNALRYNSTLLELDISDNSMKDSTFSMFCKDLRENTGLKTLKCDGNNITLSGHQCLLRAINYNKTLTSISFPIKDAKSDAKQHQICLEIIQLASKNGDHVNIDDPFVFYQNWDIPTIPAPNLCKVPQYLIDQSPVTDEEIFKAYKDAEAPTEAPPSPPTPVRSEKLKKSKDKPQSGKLESVYLIFVFYNHVLIL